MKLLLICEGDAETAHGSFSGITNSLLHHLRLAGHEVRTVDVELYGLDRYLAAAATVHPRRTRWSVRFRLGTVPSYLRSGRARRALRDAGPVDAILQIGATFDPGTASPAPRFLFCDSNIKMAERGRASGQSQAAFLTPAELRTVTARERRVYDGAAGIFTLSERLRRSFLEDFAMAPDKVRAVWGGPNFDPAAIPARPLRRGGPPTILFVGVRFERKGGDLLLRAFRRVRERVPDARLVVVGPRALDLTEPQVENLGFLRKDDPGDWSRIVQAYLEADIFCLPTRFEPFGIVFIEAMFFGLPCIGPDAWAIPEMVVSGETGYLVPPENEEALAERLIHLLQHPEEAARMGQAGAERARRLFTWSAVVERMMERIRPLVRDGAPG